MKNEINGINIFTISDSSKSYIVTTFTELELIDFQMEMINSNQEEGFLSIEKRQYNSEIQLYYDTTSFITIDNYFKENKIDKTRFLTIIKEICTIITRAEEQYLSSSNYILDIDKIYISEETLSVKLMYLPIEDTYNEDINEKIKFLLKQIIVDYANIDDRNSDNFIQRILNYIKKDTITVKELYVFLNTGVNNNVMGTAPQNIHASAIPRVQEYINDKNIQQNYNSQKDIGRNESKNENKDLSKKAGTTDNKSKKDGNGEFEVKEVYKTINIVLSIILQVIALVAALAACLLLNGLEISEKGGVVLIVGIVDYLIIKILLDKKKKVKMKIKTKTTKISEKNKAKVESNENGKAPLKNGNPPSINFSKREISTEGNYETELLTTNYPYLLSDTGESMEKIYISKERFKLGRLSSEVDYTILNNAIGKSHAEIVNEQGMLYIIDLNSKNGTFINGQRLNGNMPYQLNDNDQVMLANALYIFKLY
jgi:hypothetical protein